MTTNKPPLSSQKTCVILAVRGGGAAIMSYLTILEALQQRLGPTPWHQAIDLLAGTSAGAWTASLLSLPPKQQKSFHEYKQWIKTDGQRAMGGG